ncbi:N-formylglutamate deformylase [Asticcacaulis biprosthecium C19]|uniref:N-formylglutamate deformylase n=1 Tax=Asticcacaulis biprosthecium C19 TaxID=715226 RepID=F4QPR2_9CAUL|nr:N-formylglutamate deformylase [Asticcacaulis biprosthecium]EGF90199.1 N-formylglutamate deformylase [Asticcacaulis biprosthecium C19]
MPALAPLPDEIPLFDLHEGDGPLVVAAPHVGMHIPLDLANRMTATGRAIGETDFHVHRLFDFARNLDATTLFATHSRYVVDLNRDPEGGNLYPGKFETGLCPLSDFDRNPLYPDGDEPDAAEIEARRDTWYRPYHDRLRQTLDRAVARHGRALLIDAHSIRPEIPSLFEGRLPDLNFGTNSGATMGPHLLTVLDAWRAGLKGYSHVLDGRFRGGYTTRHYGDPARNIHALQIEIVQDCYLNSDTPHLYDEARAAPLSKALRPLIDALLAAL